MNLLLPMLAMLVLQIFVFVLPAESGERIGYSITVLLAISVFLSVVSEFLPTTVIPSIPIMCYKLLVDFFICCLIMVFSIIGMRYFLADEEEEIPEFTKRFCRRVNGFCCGKKNSNVIYVADAESDVKKEIKPVDEPDITWKDVSKAIDRCCVWIFSGILMMENMIFLGVLMFT